MDAKDGLSFIPNHLYLYAKGLIALVGERKQAIILTVYGFLSLSNLRYAGI